MDDGRIKAEHQTFNSPSAWAIHCKKIVNPNKKSGCGWASVSIMHFSLLWSGGGEGRGGGYPLILCTCCYYDLEVGVDIR